LHTSVFYGCWSRDFILMCIKTLWMKSEFFWNFWGSPNLSSSCDNDYSYFKHVSFKSIIFGRYKMTKKPLRIHAKSLSDALAPSKKNCLQLWPSAALRGFCIYSCSAHCLPDFCQKGWHCICTPYSKRVRKCMYWCTEHLFNIKTCAYMVLRTPVWMHATLSAKKCTCTRACAPMQLCRSFFDMERIANLSWVLREHCAGCRLPPALLLSRRNQSPDAVRSRNPSKSTLARDAVADTKSHKHHSIICVGADLIHFVYGSHLRLFADLILHKVLFPQFFCGLHNIYIYIHVHVNICIHVYMYVYMYK